MVGRLQGRRAAVLCAFDLIELNGKDLRRKALEERKHALANVLYRERDGIVFNQHYDGDGAIIFKASVLARVRRYCFEAPRLALSIWSHGSARHHRP